jgi:mono/diheme cytochrome c family protein
MSRWRFGVLVLSGLGWLGCTARPPSLVRGIEPEVPEGKLESEEREPSHSSLVASGAESGAAPAAERASGDFVYSREPRANQLQPTSQLPIHINASWWPFRAQHLGISEEQAQKRDARLSRSRAPAGFWDAQTSVEAVSVWTVLCNECHGGRRSLQDALETPEPAPAWGEGEGLFFGSRRAYSQMFQVVQEGGPARVGGRAQMPAWRNILSTEMIWSLLYFLEYQSGGIESRFPPSLYPRRPSMPGSE